MRPHDAITRASRPRRSPRCDGSHQTGLDARLPGDSDRCRVCTRNHVDVLVDGTLAVHAPGRGRRTPGVF